MNDASAILEESQAALERATRLEEAVGALLPDYVNLRSQARALVEAARAFSQGLKVATVPLMETTETTETMETTETVQTTETMEASAAQPAPSLGESTAPEEAGAPPAGAEETAGVEAIEAIETGEASRTAEGPRASEEAEASEEGREAREIREAEETEEPRAVTLAGSLREIATVIEQDNLVVDVNDYRFAEKAQGLIEALGDDAGGKKAARILFDCVRFMDVLDRDYSLPGYERFGQLVGRLRREVAELLKESFDIEFSPDPCVPDSESPEALAKLEAERVNSPSAEPAGRVMAVHRRGAVVRSSGPNGPNGPEGPGGRRDRLTGPPKLLVSAGSATQVFTLVYNVARAVLAPAKLPEKPRQARASAAKEIRRKYLLQLVSTAAGGGDADREATVLRYVANLLQAQNGNGQLDSLQRPLLAALEERGFKTVSVRMGGTFDDSYSTGKYERKSVPSSQPKGTIVGILQIGFVNRDGVPVQKATVGVSSGMGT